MESNSKITEIKSSPIYLKFNNLSDETRKKLSNRLRGDYGGFYRRSASIGFAYFFIGFSIIWVALLFYLADDYLWKESKSVAFGIITLPALYFLFLGLYKIYKFFRSPFKSGILVTAHYILESDCNDLKFWNIDRLNQIKSVHNYSNGRYSSTNITLHLENDVKSFQIKNLSEAEEIVEQIEEDRKLFIEATAKNDENYINSAEDFVALSKEKHKSEKKLTSRLIYVLIALVAVPSSLGVMFGAKSANNYFDDKRSWNDALKENRASSYRKYQQSHQNGRWLVESVQNLQTLYDEAESKYQASLNKGFEPTAVEAVKQAIRYAKETKNYRVKIVYERHNEIPPDIIKILKEYNEVKKLLSFGDSFSDEKITRREKILSTKIAEAFNVVIPNDILEFTDECGNECITFLVKYTFDSDTIYYSTLEEKVPYNDRVWKPAVWFDWNFAVQVPNNPKPYTFEFESNPARDIYYDSDLTEADVGKESFEKKMEAEKNLFYDATVKSAFEDFKAQLIYRTGIGEKPKDNWENTEEKKDEPENYKNQAD